MKNKQDKLQQLANKNIFHITVMKNTVVCHFIA